jgi:hypothetical protein
MNGSRERTCLSCGATFELVGADHRSLYCPAHRKGETGTLAERSESKLSRRIHEILDDVEARVERYSLLVAQAKWRARKNARDAA